AGTRNSISSTRPIVCRTMLNDTANAIEVTGLCSSRSFLDTPAIRRQGVGNGAGRVSPLPGVTLEVEFGKPAYTRAALEDRPAEHSRYVGVVGNGGWHNFTVSWT